MNKKDRQKVFEKFDGKCAYCGCELTKGWHVDELEPVRRNYKFVEVEKGNTYRGYQRKFVGYTHPERLSLENRMPSCASCNINKHSESLEDFRKAIKNYMKHLNEISTQYKIAKRYGLIEETNIEVKFFFETLGT